LLNTAGGSRLVLTANATGESSVIKVVASGGDGNLNKLNYDPLSPPVPPAPGLTQLEPAQNAQILVASFDIESETNVFEDAIDGVTITAVAESDGEEVALDVAFDKSGVQARIQKFVTEYNSMQAQLAKLGSYNAETKAAGPLLGDSLLRAIETETRRAISNPVTGLSGPYTTLASLGITTNATGALQVDSAKLTKALQPAGRPPGDRWRHRRPQHGPEGRAEGHRARQGSLQSAHGAGRDAAAQAVHRAGLAPVADAVDLQLPDAAAVEPAEDRIVRTSG
jgi:flagellar hook-associated protein 2